MLLLMHANKCNKCRHCLKMRNHRGADFVSFYTMSSPPPVKIHDATHDGKPGARTPQRPRQKRRDDFYIGEVIGRGAFGQVIKVQDKETKKYFAMKVISKGHIMKEKKINYVKIERDAMTSMSHPNIIKLYLTFQDPGNLYYVVELAQNGDLQKILNKKYALSVDNCRIILGQTILAIGHMHRRRIIHRDIKPENILLDSQNRVKLTDFGTAKMFSRDEPFFTPRGSFVGSADFVSPETLKETPVGPSTDLWSYGCMMYNLLVGKAPFHTDSNYATFKLIEKCRYTIPDFVPEDARDLINRLLQFKAEDRIGHGEYDNGYESIRNHKFFEGIDWEALPHIGIDNFESYDLALSSKENISTTPTVLEPGEDVVKEGPAVLFKKKGQKEVDLILTDSPRLVACIPGSTSTSGELTLSDNTTVSCDGTRIRVKAAEGEIEIAVEPGDVDAWIAAIEDSVKSIM